MLVIGDTLFWYSRQEFDRVAAQEGRWRLWHSQEENDRTWTLHQWRCHLLWWHVCPLRILGQNTPTLGLGHVSIICSPTKIVRCHRPYHLFYTISDLIGTFLTWDEPCEQWCCWTNCNDSISFVCDVKRNGCPIEHRWYNMSLAHSDWISIYQIVRCHLRMNEAVEDRSDHEGFSINFYAGKRRRGASMGTPMMCWVLLSRQTTGRLFLDLETRPWSCGIPLVYASIPSRMKVTVIGCRVFASPPTRPFPSLCPVAGTRSSR